MRRKLTMAFVVATLGALALGPGTALAFNPQPDPPGMPVSGMDEQFDYLYTDFGTDRENVPGRGFVPPSGVGSEAQFNPQRTTR